MFNVKTPFLERSVVKVMIVPFGEYTRRLMGMEEMPLLAPVPLSVSASISCRTSAKFVNFFPLQCRNSAYSTRADGRRGEKEDTGEQMKCV